MFLPSGAATGRRVGVALPAAGRDLNSTDGGKGAPAPLGVCALLRHRSCSAVARPCARSPHTHPPADREREEAGTSGQELLRHPRTRVVGARRVLVKAGFGQLRG